MSLAIGELAALATKAARGAGFNWSVASEAGYAAAWLEERGVAGSHSLARYLLWVEKNGIPPATNDIVTGNVDAQLTRCPIQIGCYAADSGLTNNSSSMQIREPLLLLPFLNMVTNGTTILCEIGPAKIAVGSDAIDTGILDFNSSDCASVTWAPSDATIQPTQIHSRASDDRASIRTLSNFAKKTYAPATEASRLAGAGAGTSDND